MDIKLLDEVLTVENVIIKAPFETKKEFIDYAVESLCKTGFCVDKDLLLKDILEREQAGTDIEEGLALPHAKSAAITKPVVLAATLELPWSNSTGGEDIGIAFLLVIPENAPEDHIHLISLLATLFLKDGMLKALQNSKTSQEFVQILKVHGIEHDKVKVYEGTPDILAVTACSVGVAYTYVAAEKLKIAANKLRVHLKVETDGAIGIENVLTKDEIQNARAIIVACDKTIDTKRFEGKKIIEVPISKALEDPMDLITSALLP